LEFTTSAVGGLDIVKLLHSAPALIIKIRKNRRPKDVGGYSTDVYTYSGLLWKKKSKKKSPYCSAATASWWFCNLLRKMKFAWKPCRDRWESVWNLHVGVIFHFSLFLECGINTPGQLLNLLIFIALSYNRCALLGNVWTQCQGEEISIFVIFDWNARKMRASSGKISRGQLLKVLWSKTLGTT